MLDLTTGIAGPYCSKLLADAGADVVKVEGVDGDPLRAWRSGALFEFLNASKRSVLREDGLAENADIILSTVAGDLDRLDGANPRAVVVTITPFGREGPWADRPWTEFTLQAACGSIGQRGLPEGPPLAAGGRIGEWVAGTYACLAALAALREARRSGLGEDVDVAILDCMAVSMVTYPSVFASFLGWPPLSGTGRTVEVPSVEPTSDGYFVVTTNSAQQFQDFLVMIERPDLMADTELSQVAKRFARRDEFLGAVRHHTDKRSTAEVLEEAAVLRLPAAPVLDAAGVLAFEHFRDREVFAPSPSGRFVQPRVPYRVTGCCPSALLTSPRSRRARRCGRMAGPCGSASGLDHGTAAAARGDSRRRLHRVVGRTLGDECPRGPRRRRGEGGIGRTAGPDAADERPQTARRWLVGMGPDLPLRQHRKTRDHHRPRRGGRCRVVPSPAPIGRRPGGELHPPCDGAVRAHVGLGPCAQPGARDGPDAGVRARRALEGPDRFCPDHGGGQRHGLADGIPRWPANAGPWRVRPHRGDAHGGGDAAGPHGARPGGPGIPRGIRDGRGRAQCRGASRSSNTPRSARRRAARETGGPRRPRKGCIGAGATTVGSPSRWRATASGPLWCAPWAGRNGRSPTISRRRRGAGAGTI